MPTAEWYLNFMFSKLLTTFVAKERKIRNDNDNFSSLRQMVICAATILNAKPGYYSCNISWCIQEN